MRVAKNGRNPSNYPTDGVGVPLRITRMFPMKLKDVTLDKLKDKRIESEVVCINELMSLFDCFENSDYNAKICQTQANLLEQCYSSHMLKKKTLKAERRQELAKNK